ncbi:MAG: hypothetical protein K6U80_20495, partial [Firmicutes bacterium]|nr:hypothetical protein [Bacillota bacterium]
ILVSVNGGTIDTETGVFTPYTPDSGGSGITVTNNPTTPSGVNSNISSTLKNVGLSQISLGSFYDSLYYGSSPQINVPVGSDSISYNLEHMRDDLQLLAALQQSNPDRARYFEGYVKEKYKFFWDYCSGANGTTILGLRGWGIGGGISQNAINHGEHDYNDMLVVLTDGKIGVFSRVNFEGTTYKGNVTVNGKAEYKTGEYPNIADGSYDVNLGWHKKKYAALWVNNNLEVSIQQLWNPAHKNKHYMENCHIHRGGSEWTWSEGCITIWDPTNTSDWGRFISYFPSNPKNPNYGGSLGISGMPSTYGLNDGQNVGRLKIMSL